MPPAPLPCPSCAALVWDHPVHIEQHAGWHWPTDEELGERVELLRQFAEARDLYRLALAENDDGPATAKLPPLGETIRRKPPVPGTELTNGAAWLHAVAEDLTRIAAYVPEHVWDCRVHPGRLWFTADEWSQHLREEHPEHRP